MAETLSEIELNRIDAEIRKAEKCTIVTMVTLSCWQARALFDAAKMAGDLAEATRELSLIKGECAKE